ncbi:MAG: hypothetical protein K2I96_21475 [Lachnospiraceae bacterium]|nr:hypothetical protein [Lachnospiraceae bacterium]
MEDKDALIDFYGYQSEIWGRGYQMMGQLLDRNFVAHKVEKWNITNVYIYGGGYLGIQLYRAITPFSNVLSIVDKNGKLKVEIKDIPVMNLDIFRQYYKDEPVIITPLQYYKEICNELQDVVSMGKIIFLEEFGRK